MNDYLEQEGGEQKSGKNFSLTDYLDFKEEEQKTPTVKGGLIRVRETIERLEKTGLVLSEFSADELKMLLFSDDIDKAIDKVTMEMSRNQVKQLFYNEAKTIVENGIPITLDDDNYAKWDVNLLQEKLTRLAEIFKSKKYRYRVKTKKELVMSFIAKVAKDIESEQSRGDNYNKSMFHYDREYGSYADEFPHELLEMTTNFPSLNLSEKEVLRFCAERVNQDPDSIYDISAG